jgi:hypothetical protein
MLNVANRAVSSFPSPAGFPSVPLAAAVPDSPATVAAVPAVARTRRLVASIVMQFTARTDSK